MILKTNELFNTEHTIAKSLLDGCEYPHMALPKIKEFIKEYFLLLDDSFKEISDGVFVAEDAKIWDGATIVGPTIIGHKAEIRPGAFIRGSVIIGDGAVIGNSTEVKNAILFDGVQIPHFNYCGDSILGYKAHMAAGVITSNVKSDKTNVTIRTEDGRIETGLRKLGALVGDFVEIGCNTVLNPGTVIGRNTTVYPLSRVRGIIPAGHIYKSETQIVPKQEK